MPNNINKRAKSEAKDAPSEDDWDTGVRFGGHDQERGHTSVNRSCILALRSVTYFDFQSDQTTTENLSRFSSGPRWRT